MNSWTLTLDNLNTDNRPGHHDTVMLIRNRQKS